MLEAFFHSSKVFRAHLVFLPENKPLTECRKLVVTHELRKTGMGVGCKGGREGGLGPATELEVELSPKAEFHAQSVDLHMPKQNGEQ